MEVPESAVDPPESERKLHGPVGRLCATNCVQLNRAANAIQLRFNAGTDIQQAISLVVRAIRARKQSRDVVVVALDIVQICR
jgi:hypothetical protein